VTQAPPEDYPPAQHVLRDLRLTVEHHPDGTALAWIPAPPEIRNLSGSVRAGALAVLVDVVGGGLAAVAARPDWIATADLSLHLTPRRVGGDVEARGRVVRKGRTTVVLEVDLVDTAGGASLGLATMTFAVLPRRDTNLSVDQADLVTQVSFGLEDSCFATGFHEQVQLTVVDAGAGVTELALRDYVRNSMGAVQGGIVAAAASAAAEHAVADACGGPVEAVDLQISYLALVKAGPMRTTAMVLDAQPAFGTTRVEIVDAGADERVTTVARVVAVRP
jgi:uncharacterized protein (TIGR00369 family)